MFVTYMTTYSGDKFPPLYIGSTTAKRIASGYHGSARSKKYRATWESELKSAKHLFDTFVLSEHSTADEALKAEDDLQHLFNAVRSPTFVNMAYARKGFINPGSFSDEVRSVMSIKAKARGMKKAQAAGTAARTGMKDSEETKAKRNASSSITVMAKMALLSDEEKKLKFGTRKGSTWSAEQHAKRAATTAAKRVAKEI